MPNNKFFYSKSIYAVLIAISVGAQGCHVDDTNSTSVVSDTSTVVAGDATMAQDSAMNTMDKMNDDKMMKGTAKPNPAKKGMKGKVVILDAPKKVGSMNADKAGVYTNVEAYPSFPGGNKGLQNYFDKNLAYPEDATNDGVEGTVNVMFTVDETGKLSDPHTMGDNLGYGLETEALRVVKTMPAWEPGKLKGKNVKTTFTLPVKFQLY